MHQATLVKLIFLSPFPVGILDTSAYCKAPTGDVMTPAESRHDHSCIISGLLVPCVCQHDMLTGTRKLRLDSCFAGGTSHRVSSLKPNTISPFRPMSLLTFYLGSIALERRPRRISASRASSALCEREASLLARLVRLRTLKSELRKKRRTRMSYAQWMVWQHVHQLAFLTSSMFDTRKKRTPALETRSTMVVSPTSCDRPSAAVPSEPRSHNTM